MVFKATGTTQKFTEMANKIIDVYKLQVAEDGTVSIARTAQGPLPLASDVLLDVIEVLIGATATITIDFLYNANSGDTPIADFTTGTVDLFDIQKFGFGVQVGPNAAAILAHELVEQYHRQVHNRQYFNMLPSGQPDPNSAHFQAADVEASAFGGQRLTALHVPFTILDIGGTNLALVMVQFQYPKGSIFVGTYGFNAAGQLAFRQMQHAAPVQGEKLTGVTPTISILPETHVTLNKVRSVLQSAPYKLANKSILIVTLMYDTNVNIQKVKRYTFASGAAVVQPNWSAFGISAAQATQLQVTFP